MLHTVIHKPMNAQANLEGGGGGGHLSHHSQGRGGGAVSQGLTYKGLQFSLRYLPASL